MKSPLILVSIPKSFNFKTEYLGNLKLRSYLISDLEIFLLFDDDLSLLKKYLSTFISVFSALF